MGRRSWPPLLAAGLSALGLLVLLLLFIKWPPHRVILPVLGGMWVMLLWFGLHENATGSLRHRLLTAICGAALLYPLMVVLPAVRAANRDFQRGSALALTELGRLNSDRAQLYFTWENSFPYELTFLPFNHHSELFRNHLQVGSWSMHIPTSEAMLRRFDVSRPYEDLANNPRMFLLARPEGVETYRRFMKETYRREVEAEPVMTGTYLLVWRVIERKK